MTRQLAIASIAVGYLLGCLGCAAPATYSASILPGLGGAAPDTAHVVTTTSLSDANFRVVHTGAKGQSQGFVLLLFFNIIPTSLTDAVDRLYDDAELEPGGAWALANVMIERQARNFLLFGLPRVRVRADVVEFVAESETEGDAVERRPAHDDGTVP
jgi:hypothetical protein